MNMELVHNIRVIPFDSSCLEKKFLASYGCRNFEVSESVGLFIGIIKSSNTSTEVALKLSEIKQENYSENDVKALYEKCIAPILIEQGTKPKDLFLWKTELVPPSIVEIFLKILGFFFKPVVMFMMLAAIIISEIVFFSNDLMFSLGHVDVFVIIGIVLLFIASSFFHELGHATACRHFGADQRGIGFGLYLNFPAFYTDVSDIWKLTRRQRMVVNFAGIYFQLIFLLPLFAIFFATGNPFVKYFIITINFNFIFTLNPFFKFDGYWIMTDMLGVANLRTRSQELFIHVKNKVLRKRPVEKSFLTTIKGTERLFLIIYSIIVNLFFLYYFGYVLPRFLRMFIIYFPEQLNNLINQIATGNIPSFNLIVTVLGQLLAFSLMMFFAYTMLNPFVKKGINIFRNKK